MLLKHGGTVIAGNRNMQKADKIKQETINELLNMKHLNLKKNDLLKRYILLKLDLSSLQSIKQFVIEFNKLNINLNCLINNAAVGTLPNYTLTKDGFEMLFAVNHLGLVYIFILLSLQY